MDIKYVEVPVRVKPTTQYLDMKGVDALWEQIKEYVRTHGGEGGTVGAVNEEEVNAIIAKYYEDHRDELKGEPFTYGDFTMAQLEALRGPQGEPGAPGKDGQDGAPGRDGIDGTVEFDYLSEEQKASLKGEQGEKGEPFKYSDFTPEQLEALRGPKGADGTMTFSDLTEEQRESLRGPQGETGPQGQKGDTGDTGKPFTFDMFTEDQLNMLRGPAGDSITWDSLTDEQKAELKGDPGERGPQGIPGTPGEKGEPGVVDYSKVYTKQQVDDLLRNVDLDPEDIDLSNYYIKDELYNRGEVDALIASLVIEGAAGVHIGPNAPEIAGVSVWVDTNGIPYDEQGVDLEELFYDKGQIDNIIETHTHRLSEMEIDINVGGDIEVPTKVSDLIDDVGILTVNEVYEKSEVYNKEEIDATMEGVWKKTDTLPDKHTHTNLSILESLSEADGKLLYNGEQIATGDEVDLSEFAKQSDVNTQLANGLATKANTTHTHTGYLRFEVVSAAPTDQEEGVLYIVV